MAVCGGGDEEKKETKIAKYEDLQEGLTNLPNNFEQFAICLRALYADKTVSGRTKEGKTFNEIRNRVRDKALIFKMRGFPMALQTVVDIKTYMGYYTDLDYEEWYENIDEIYKEVVCYGERAELARLVFEKLQSELYKEEDNIKTNIKQFGELSKAYDKELKKITESVESKKNWMVALTFVPFVNVVAVPLIGASMQADVKNKIAQESNKRSCYGALKAAREILLPALKHICKGLQILAQFFNYLKAELMQLMNKTDGGKRKKETGDKATLFYKTAVKQAKRIFGYCDHYIITIEKAKPHLGAIPQGDCQLSTADKWLAEQLKNHPSKLKVFKKFLKREKARKKD